MELIYMPMVLLFIVFIIVLLPKYFRFRNSDYQFKSGNSFFKTIFDKGSYGEFLTFSYLEELKMFKKLLVNIYVPKEDGLTTEIDLIMLSPTGIYVFESKNYSGWILEMKSRGTGPKHWKVSKRTNFIILFGKTKAISQRLRSF